MLLIFFSAVLALCFVIGKGEETKFILSTGGVLKYPQSGAEFEIHKFQGLKKKKYSLCLEDLVALTLAGQNLQ